MPPRDAAPRRAHRRLGGALLLAPGAASGRRATAGCRATRGSTRTRELREKLDELGRALGGAYRVLVDANQHVDREAAARSGVGFYGKNTLLITRRHGSWVVLGTLVTDVELEPTPPLDARLRRLPPLHRRLPDRRARRAGHARRDALPLVLDAGAGADPPEEYRAELGAQVYGCDICQDVCPWNRGVEKRRAGEPLPAGREPHVSLVDWLARRPRRAAAPLRAALRPAQRRPPAPAQRPRRSRQRGRRRRTDAVTACLDDPDETTRELAAWALARLEERDA